MGQIHTPASLALKLQSVIRDALENEISEKMVDVVKEHVDKDVYAKYTPSEDGYKRTETLKESVQRTVNSSNDGAEVVIDHDSAKMNYWSVLGDDVDQQGIPRMIEDGTIHPLFGGGFSYLQPRTYMNNSKEEIMKKLDNLIAKAVAKRLT